MNRLESPAFFYIYSPEFEAGVKWGESDDLPHLHRGRVADVG